VKYIVGVQALEPLQLLERTHVRWRARRLLYFSGCDYFRMASHPAVLRAVRHGLSKFGLNVAASRLTTGHHKVYAQLESALADYFKATAALLVSNGYVTSTVVAQALAGQFTHVLLDERAHAALVDAAGQFGAPVRRFDHRHAAALQAEARRCGRNAKVIVLTDGMFSHDGSVAPLREYVKRLPASTWFLVDDAHGAGVLGEQGRGTVESEGVGRARVIQCATLSKAFGVYGGAVLGSVALRKAILERSRAFMGCTPLPLPLASGALVSIELLKRSQRARERLHSNAGRLKAQLRAAGFSVPDFPGPIVALLPRSVVQADAIRRSLLCAGIYPPYLCYGGVAAGYFRFVVSSEHTQAHLQTLVRALRPFAPL